jgi:hypothetical protein
MLGKRYEASRNAIIVSQLNEHAGQVNEVSERQVIWLTDKSTELWHPTKLPI